MNFLLKTLTKSGIGGWVKALVFLFLTTVLVGCGGYANDLSSSSENSDVVNAAQAEIEHANQLNSKDTQCSDFVAAVLRRLGLQVPAFHANDFDKIAAKYLPQWSMTEFTTEDLANGRASLRQYLNSFPDHTAFFAQWPRNGQSGHVAIVEKVSYDSYVIYQAQAGLSTPYKKAAKVESLLYGSVGVDRSKIRLWTE